MHLKPKKLGATLRGTKFDIMRGAPQLALIDMICKKAKPGLKPCKLSDGNGLYLEIRPNGSKYWRLKYRFAGKEIRLSFGIYPEVSLKEA